MSDRVFTHRAEYANIRPLIQPLDLISTSHRSFFGRMIQVGQGGRHPWHSIAVDRMENGRIICWESTAGEAGAKNTRGVRWVYLSDVIKRTNGNVWISRLNYAVRNSLDIEAGQTWMRSREGKSYSYRRAIKSGLDMWIRILRETPASDATFCSEYYFAALRNAGYNVEREYSCTPAQLTRFNGLWGAHYQVKGEKLISIG